MDAYAHLVHPLFTISVEGAALFSSIDEPSVLAGALYAAFTLVLVIFYYARVASIKKRGIDWDEQIRHMPGPDEV